MRDFFKDCPATSKSFVNTQRKGTGKARKALAKVEQDMPFRLWAT